MGRSVSCDVTDVPKERVASFFRVFDRGLKIYTNEAGFEIPIAVTIGHAVAYMIEALCYKPEGRGFESR
jgi:hypothetical protein